VSTEVGPLNLVVVKHPHDAFVSQDEIRRQWRDLHFLSEPDLGRAVDEAGAFVEILRGAGAEVRTLPRGTGVGLDSIYARDASVVAPGGMVLARMGKRERAGEPEAQGAAFREWGIPVVGAIHPPGALEGGDVVWLSEQAVAVGRGYRTNDDGIRQLQRLVGPTVEVIVVPLPHWRGPADVFHLMSIISPVDRDLAVVYSPLMPVPFRERLLDLGCALVDVPDDEFESMGTNVLALAPRRCLMLDGNPETRARLERAGAEVVVYRGREISVPGCGGPTCLTRPIVRGPG
jgi:N-dimethylarginine dimethylaminohydrolase